MDIVQHLNINNTKTKTCVESVKTKSYIYEAGHRLLRCGNLQWVSESSLLLICLKSVIRQ